MGKAEKIICAGCFLLVAVHLMASYFPGERLWGVNLLYYLPPIWRWILVICGLLILIPFVNSAVGTLLARFSHWITGALGKLNKCYKYAFIGLTGGALFWAFRVKTFLLGDSFLRAREINMGKAFSFSAPLDYFLHGKVATLLSWDAFQVYVVLSVLAGAVFLPLLLFLRDKIGTDSKERILVFVVIITMGTSQLFFGYVESYTLVYVAMIAYIFLSLGYLRNKNGLILPILFFLLSLSLHLLAMTLLPSLVYLIFAARSRKTDRLKKQTRLFELFLSTGMILMVGFSFLILQSYDPDTRGLSSYFIFPLGNGESSYSLFSSSHLLDFINHQLLISPVGGLILIASVLAFSKRTDLKDKTVRFLLLVTVCSLAYAFLVDPKLGYPRDWDLFAFAGVGYTLLGVHIFLKHWGERKLGDLRYVTLSLLFTSLISTAPWIYVNASEEKALERCEHLLDLDEKRSAYGHEILAMYYGTKREWQKEAPHWAKAIALTGSARYMTNLAVAYVNLKEYDLALGELKRSLKVNSTYHFTHFVLGELFARMGRFEEAIAEYRKAVQLKPSNIQYYDNLGSLLSDLQRHEEAAVVFEQGLKANPNYLPMYRKLGYTYFRLGQLSRGEEYLKLYLRHSPQAGDAAEVRQVLREISQERSRQPEP
jgi:tetratricopeptide (TPR) repeat protein